MVEKSNEEAIKAFLMVLVRVTSEDEMVREFINLFGDNDMLKEWALSFAADCDWKPPR